MGINVQYGDIGSALGLALRGGQAIRQRQQSQQDTQFLDLVSQEQARADASHAQEISQALGADKTNADLTMDQRKMDMSNQQNQAEDALKQQQLAQQAEETKARMAQSDALNAQTHQYQTADHAMKVQQFQDKQKADAEKEAAIASLTPEQQAVVKATGRMPYVPNNGGDPDSKAFTLLEGESRRMEAEIKQRETAAAATLEGKLGQAPHDPQLEALKAQKIALDAELAKRTSGMIQNGTLNNARIAQQAQQSRVNQSQSAPAQQPRIVAQERNPQDGKMWGFDANQGRWIPLE